MSEIDRSTGEMVHYASLTDKSMVHHSALKGTTQRESWQTFGSAQHHKNALTLMAPIRDAYQCVSQEDYDCMCFVCCCCCNNGRLIL